MQLTLSAPFVRRSRKSTHGPLDEDRALARALDAMRGIDQIQPVMFGGKLLAWAKGEQGRGDVSWRRPRAHEKWWCGFTSYDDLISEVSGSNKKYRTEWSKIATTTGVASNYYDLWPNGGSPTAGTYTGAAFTARSLDDTSVGALYHGGNVSTDTKHFLSAYAKASANTPTIYLYDRVLTYEACTLNGNVNQAMTNGVAAARYIAAGEGAMKICVTAQTAIGASNSNLTVCSYTDQDGNAANLVPQTPVPAIIVSAAAPTTTLGARVVAPSTTAGTLPWGPHLPLATGDGGARSIENFTTSVANTGTLCFLLQRILAVIPCPSAGVASLVNLIQEIPSMERVRDGACLAIMAYQPLTTGYTGDGGCEWGYG